MRAFAVVFLLTVLCATSIAQSGPPNLPQYTTYKSFYTALYECAEYYNMCNSTVDDYIRSGYPNTLEGNRLLHCAMFNLGMWSDSTGGKENVIQYYFQPNPNDVDYVEQTRQCISNALSCVDQCDQNTRAYLTFTCYRSHYGCLVEPAQYVPLTNNEFFEVLSFIVKVLRIPRETLQKFSEGNYLDDPVFKNLLWIFAVRSVNYQTNFNMDLDYMQYGLPQLISPDTRCCVANVYQQYSGVDKREQFYQVYKVCEDPILRSSIVGAFNVFLNGP